MPRLSLRTHQRAQVYGSYEYYLVRAARYLATSRRFRLRGDHRSAIFFLRRAHEARAIVTYPRGIQ